MEILWIVLVVSLFEALAQSLAYKSTIDKSGGVFALAWLAYLCVLYLLTRAYKHAGVGFINVLWSGMTSVIILIVGRVFFGENIPMHAWIGVALVLAGIAIMHIKVTRT